MSFTEPAFVVVDSAVLRAKVGISPADAERLARRLGDSASLGVSSDPGACHKQTVCMIMAIEELTVANEEAIVRASWTPAVQGVRRCGHVNASIRLSTKDSRVRIIDRSSVDYEDCGGEGK
jgi:hypothetical protein